MEIAFGVWVASSIETDKCRSSYSQINMDSTDEI